MPYVMYQHPGVFGVLVGVLDVIVCILGVLVGALDVFGITMMF